MFAAGVRFPSECVEEVQRQRKMLWDAAAFILSNQIPAVVSLVMSIDVHPVLCMNLDDDDDGVCVCVWQLRDCLDHTAVPMDGATLTSVLHQHGVNVRYLGTLLRELHAVEERERLDHVKVITTPISLCYQLQDKCVKLIELATTAVPFCYSLLALD